MKQDKRSIQKEGDSTRSPLPEQQQACVTHVWFHEQGVSAQLKWISGHDSERAAQNRFGIGQAYHTIAHTHLETPPQSIRVEKASLKRQGRT